MNSFNSSPGTGLDALSLDRSLVQTLAVGLRTAELYQPDNAVVTAVVARLKELLHQRINQGPVELGVRNRCMFANGRRVRLSAADYPRFAYLLRVFEDWRIQGFTFWGALSAKQLATFLWIVANEREGSTETLVDRLERAQLIDVEVIAAAEDGTQVRQRDKGSTATGPYIAGGLPGVSAGRSGWANDDSPETAYFKAVTVAQHANENLRRGDRLGARRVRRVTQAIVDHVIREPTSLLALSTIKDYDMYLISHSTNVAILSAMLGLRLGLAKSELGELTLAAFLHDIGKTALPDELVTKPGALTDDEWLDMRRHPQLGALAILEQQHLTPSMMRALRVAYEHHVNYDLGGYPHLPGLTRTSLFSRIIMVADRYDAMTTSRPYRRHNFTPFEAIGYLAARAGTAVDPVVLRYFVEMMGIYPVGTLLRLTNGEVGVVQAPPGEGSASNRPVIRLLSDNTEIDLNAVDDTGVFIYDILEVANPGNIGQVAAVSPERLVVSDTEGDEIA